MRNWKTLEIGMLTAMIAAAMVGCATRPAGHGEIDVAAAIARDGGDAATVIQKLIDGNPNRTLYFADGVYELSKPIVTSAKATETVAMRLADFAILRAAPGWTNVEAMVRLGGKGFVRDLESVGANYSFRGGVIDGSGVATGLSIESGLQTVVKDTTIKNVQVGIHIRIGANGGSADADLANINIWGNNATNSIGLWVEGSDNTISDMRIGAVHVGVDVGGGNNILRNLHPLYVEPFDQNYQTSVGFINRGLNTTFDRCYSDHFATAFETTPGVHGIYNNCICWWYKPEPGFTHVAFKADGIFQSTVNDFHVGFVDAKSHNAVLTVGRKGGEGYINGLWVNEQSVHPDERTHFDYLRGSIISSETGLPERLGE